MSKADKQQDQGQSSAPIEAPAPATRVLRRVPRQAPLQDVGPYFQVEDTHIRVVFDHNIAYEGQAPAEPPSTLYVIDISGSMSGGPWRQVKEAVQYIQQNSTPGNEPDFALYDSGARFATVEELLATNPRFRTSFKAAFTVIGQYVSNKPVNSNINIVFLTDGEDTVAGKKELQEIVARFNELLVRSRRNVVIHAVGFSADHDRDFLLTITQMGAGGGAYRYAEGQGLDTRFGEIFDFLSTTRRANLTIGTHPLVANGEHIHPGVLHFDVMLERAQYDPDGVLFGESEEAAIEIDGEVKILTRRVPDAFFQMRMIDVMEIKTIDELNRAQVVLSSVNPMRFAKADRETALECRQHVQERLDEYHALFAEASRGGLPEDSVASRLQSLRYDAQFSKARRRRKMDIRARNNAARMDDINTQLESLEPVLTVYEDMELTCPLSGVTIHEVMSDSNSDVMVIPLRVQRPEHTVDAPSQINVLDVLSGTYSYESLQDSMAFALRQHRPEDAHGGFGSVGETTGMFRGPDGKYMNACLPLYINKDHWDRVEAQIEPILGYFFTLDPLGFKSDQYLALYNILGVMLSMRKQGLFSSEYADFVIEDFTKLCRAIAPRVIQSLINGEYGNGVLRADPVESFIASPKYRTKEVFQNLFVVMGWHEAITLHPDNPSTDYEHFAAAMTEELWRRCFGLHYKEAPREVVLETLEKLLYGPGIDEDGPVVASRSSSLMKQEMARQKKEDAQYERYAEYRLGLLSKSATKSLCGSAPETPQPVSRMRHEEEGEASVPENYTPRQLVEYDQASDEIQAYFDHFCSVELGHIQNNPLVEQIMQLIDRIYVGKQKRLMVIQALQFYSNTLVNAAVAHDTYIDTTTSSELDIMALAHDGFEKRRREKSMASQVSEDVFNVAKRLARTTSTLGFVGRLMRECPTRGGPVFEQFARLLSTGSVDGSRIPLRAMKIRTLLTGRLTVEESHGEQGIIGDGTSWCDCPIALAAQFKTVVGDDEFGLINAAMYGRFGHVYRETDIPNRHGYHVSHPNPDLVWEFTGFSFQNDH